MVPSGPGAESYSLSTSEHYYHLISLCFKLVRLYVYGTVLYGMTDLSDCSENSTRRVKIFIHTLCYVSPTVNGGLATKLNSRLTLGAVSLCSPVSQCSDSPNCGSFACGRLVAHVSIFFLFIDVVTR